jgi:hypothetical protein
MTLAPTPEQQAEDVSPLALKWAALIAKCQAERGPLSRDSLATILTTYELEMHLEIRQRMLPDGEEICEVQHVSCGCALCDINAPQITFTDGHFYHQAGVNAGFVRCTKRCELGRRLDG